MAKTVLKRVRGSPKRPYTMTVAGQLIKHLGLQMYSGAVPAISELISNAYDAMARNVWITIPTGRSIEPNDEIVVNFIKLYDDDQRVHVNITLSDAALTAHAVADGRTTWDNSDLYALTPCEPWPTPVTEEISNVVA